MTANNLILPVLLILSFALNIRAQTNFSSNPLEAKFITEDVQRFWECFDKIDSSSTNPFNEYVEKGSPGVKGFMMGRIVNADSLYKMVLRRKEDYKKSRNVLRDLESKKKKIKAIYAAMKYWYPEAVFPPIYFLIGRFNTGGTTSDAGLLLGTEMLKNLDGLPGLVAHELIHFQQKIFGDNCLLKQSILEGSADFLGELISGDFINPVPFDYGELHKDSLSKEFVLRISQEDISDWLYGTTGKDDRPNDLGYWMGYKITSAYFNKQKDKQQAVHNIINIDDPYKFLEESGYLDKYIDEVVKATGKQRESLFRRYSVDTYEITFKVTVPDKNDTVYITGNQPGLANWNPEKLMLKRTSDFERQITLKIHTPAQFKFTRGTWDKEAFIDGIEGIPNLQLEVSKNGEAEYKVLNWKDKQ